MDKKKNAGRTMLICLLAVIVAFTFLSTDTDTAYAASGSSTKIAKVSDVKVAKSLNANGKVRISWKKVKNATSYQVYYKKASSSKWSVKKVKTNSVKLKLKNGIKYKIKVRAAKGRKKGKFSIVRRVRVVRHKAQYKTVHHDAEYKTVHHDAVTHQEKILVKEAWDETVKEAYDEEVTMYKIETHSFCGGCDEDVSWRMALDREAIKAIEDAGGEYTSYTQLPEDGWEHHLLEHYLNNEPTNSYDKGVQVPYTETIHHEAEIVHHDAEYKTKTVVDKEAWDEKVLVKKAWTEKKLVKKAWTEVRAS